MCVAIAKPADKNISKETLQLCFKQNPDGCGFAYIDEQGLPVMFKSMDFDSFYVAYKNASEQYSSSPFLIHFRIKTHGTKDIFNCHPFQIDGDMVFIHNGVITAAPDCPDKQKSDTQMFNETILQQLPEGWIDFSGIRKLVENYISYSKLAVLHRRNGGEIILFNEEKGSWKDGIWFSNLHWEPRETYYSKKSHLDTCLHCNKNIKNNHYADRHGVSFCSWACEGDFRKSKSSSWKNMCDCCGAKLTYIHITNDKGSFEYCSKSCTDKHQDTLDKIVYPQLKLVHKEEDSDLTVQCAWCGDWNHNSECIEFDGFYNQSSTEFICATCVRDAISAGLITNTPEVQEAVRKIISPSTSVANA